ncbi:MAG: hypothetical protein ABSH09_24085 [Bryobacteraceae bacterium]
MANWTLESARLTVFLEPNFTRFPTLWDDVVGEEPETSIFQKPTAMRVAYGPFAGGRLQLQAQPVRLDWIFDAPEPGDETGKRNTLGAFPDGATPLLELVYRWAKSNSFPETRRIALGFTLITPALDRLSGYRELRNFIDGVPANEEASDFLYQVNIPRKSTTGIEGLTINRLSKWSVMLVRLMALSSFGAVLEGPENSVVHLDLDINTPQNFGMIPKERIREVIDDLLSGALEISNSGTHSK